MAHCGHAVLGSPCEKAVPRRPLVGLSESRPAHAEWEGDTGGEVPVVNARVKTRRWQPQQRDVKETMHWNDFNK